MDIGHPPGPSQACQPRAGLYILPCRGHPTLPPSLPPPNKQQQDEILTHRFQHRESISLSQKIIATTALPLAHLSLLPAKLPPCPVKGRHRETLRNLLRTFVSHPSLGEGRRSCRPCRVDISLWPVRRGRDRALLPAPSPGRAYRPRRRRIGYGPGPARLTRAPGASQIRLEASTNQEV